MEAGAGGGATQAEGGSGRGGGGGAGGGGGRRRRLPSSPTEKGEPKGVSPSSSPAAPAAEGAAGNKTPSANRSPGRRGGRGGRKPKPRAANTAPTEESSAVDELAEVGVVQAAAAEPEPEPEHEHEQEQEHEHEPEPVAEPEAEEQKLVAASVPSPAPAPAPAPAPSTGALYLDFSGDLETPARRPLVTPASDKAQQASPALSSGGYLILECTIPETLNAADDSFSGAGYDGASTGSRSAGGRSASRSFTVVHDGRYYEVHTPPDAQPGEVINVIVLPGTALRGPGLFSPQAGSSVASTPGSSPLSRSLCAPSPVFLSGAALPDSSSFYSSPSSSSAAALRALHARLHDVLAQVDARIAKTIGGVKDSAASTLSAINENIVIQVSCLLAATVIVCCSGSVICLTVLRHFAPPPHTHTPHHYRT